MSDIKIYGKLKSGVTTKALIDATEVSGGFMSLTTDEMNSLSDALKVEGMLVYCTSDSKFYQLKEGKWAVALEQEQKTIGEVVTDVSFSGSQSVSLVKTLKNIETGAYSTDTTAVPIAHNSGSGLMSASDYNLLQTLSQNVQQLQGSQVRLLYTDSANPLQSQISDFVTSKGYTDYTGISVVIDATQHVWRYYSNDNIGWKDDGLDIVTTFTNDTAGIIKGSTENGKINAESDGTGSVNGWSDLTQRVSNVESQATVQNLIGEINLTNEGTTVEKQDNSLLVKSTCKISNHDNTISTPVTAQFNVPIKAGNNITFTEATDKSAVIISATASAEVLQPDYNQNDSTASDYIKNRPFYDEAPTIETILDQTFSTITAGGVNFWATNTSVIQFVKGDTVKVVYNGTEYIQEVKELNAVLYIGNISLGGLSPATDEPFLVANIYFPDGLSTLTPGTTVATSTAQTNATIKITKEIENVKTIDPKYIKDMYYENVVETELYNGTLTNTKSASGEYYTATLSSFFRLGKDNDKLSVIINNVEKILTVVSYALWEEAGSLAADGITIISSDSAVHIDTNAQYTNATIIVTNIHSDVHSIPQKYVNSEEYLIEISVTSTSDEDIALALKKYLNDNPSELNAIRSRTSWVLKAVATSGDVKIPVAYRWTTHSAYGVALFEDEDALTFTSFSRNSIDAVDKTFKTKQTTMAINVFDRIVRSIELTSTLLLDDSSWVFGVVDNMNADTDPSNGTLALYSEKSGGGYCNTFNGIVTLHSWITKAQQRSDFVIPTPTKDTDLVDKKYTDTAISNAITKTLNTEV